LSKCFWVCAADGQLVHPVLNPSTWAVAGLVDTDLSFSSFLEL
jgi:hypothetical protein